MLTIEKVPDLHEPVFVVAMSGWVDAGIAGAGAAAVLVDQLHGISRFATIDLADLLDLQQTRPSVKLVAGATREITWPSVDFVAGRAGRDVVLCTGPEPSVRWRQLTREIAKLASDLGVTQGVMLGGMPAVRSHRRPVDVLATATDASLAEEVGALRTDYTGPTGAQTVIQVALGEVGIPAVGLWAQVPHYIAGNPSPPAIAAILSSLRDFAGVQVDLTMLDRQADEYRDRVERSLVERPEVAEMVRAIEAGDPELPTGDELATEIERYLRDEG